MGNSNPNAEILSFFKTQCVNSSCAETNIFQEHSVYSIAADALGSLHRHDIINHDTDNGG